MLLREYVRLALIVNTGLDVSPQRYARAKRLMYRYNKNRHKLIR